MVEKPFENCGSVILVEVDICLLVRGIGVAYLRGGLVLFQVRYCSFGLLASIGGLERWLCICVLIVGRLRVL